MNQRVRPEVAGPMTGSAKSVNDLRAGTPVPDFADAHPGYGMALAPSLGQFRH
jgi:hypothetical protein